MRVAGLLLLLGSVLALLAGPQGRRTERVETPQIQDDLRIGPGEAPRSSGYLPGPFLPPTHKLILGNDGSASLDWQAQAKTRWLSLSSNAGTLEPGARETLVLTIDQEQIGALGPGRHGAEVLFRNRTSGQVQERTLYVDVLQAGLRIRSPEVSRFQGLPGGPFEPEQLVSHLFNNGPQPLVWEAACDASWLDLVGNQGPLISEQQRPLSVRLNAEAAQLPEGEHWATIRIAESDRDEPPVEWKVCLSVRIPTVLEVTLVEPAGEELDVVLPEGTDPVQLAYRVENAGPHEMAWKALVTEDWLEVSPREGEIGPHQSIEMAVRVDREKEARNDRAGIALVNTSDGLGTTLLTIVRTPSGGAAPEGATPGLARSVERFAIRWTFDREVPCGEFVNGDPWVVGPALLVAIDPPSRKVGQRTLNGSMLDPDPGRGTIQGYDSAMYGKYATPEDYDPALNVGLDLSTARPLLLRSSCSLVSAISVPEPNARPQLRSAAILTVLDRPPPPDAFRPAYVGHDKRVRHRAGAIDYQRLGRLAPIPGTPRLAEVEKWFERPWLDHIPDWTGLFIHPTESMPGYGREMADQIGIGSLMLQLDFPEEQKRTLAIRMVQLGIDFYGILATGSLNHWPAGGGHHSGRKWPILMAGILLGDPEMSGVDALGAAFNEDDQTFYVEETSPGVYNYGQGGYGPQDVGLAEWGSQHWKQLRRGQLPLFDNNDWFEDDYRLCCTANAWWGEILAAHIMQAKELWGHDALFDYQDRYFAENARRKVDDWRLSWSRFPLGMWRAYRNRYP